MKASYRVLLDKTEFPMAPDTVKPNHTHSQAYSNTESTSPTYRDVNNPLAYHHPEDAAVTWYTCSVVMLTILSPPSTGHPPTQLPNWFHYQEMSHWQWPLSDQWWRKLNIKHISSLTVACCQLRFLPVLSLGILMSLFPATVSVISVELSIISSHSKLIYCFFFVFFCNDFVAHPATHILLRGVLLLAPALWMFLSFFISFLFMSSFLWRRIISDRS